MEYISKPDARALGRGVRASMDAEQRREASASIARRCREQLPWRDGMKIHIFMSIVTNFEVDTRQLLAWLFGYVKDAQVFAPKMNGSYMQEAAIFPSTEYAINQMGIPEPPQENVVNESKMDLILVPLLAFDGVGHRVGYGGGHYDRLLARQPAALKVGLAYSRSAILDRTIVAEVHDIPLDLVVTETAVHSFA